MQTPKELSKEMVVICRRLIHQQPERKRPQSKIGKSVFQGIMIALFAVSASSGTGETPDRSGPWDTT